MRILAKVFFFLLFFSSLASAAPVPGLQSVYLRDSGVLALIADSDADCQSLYAKFTNACNLKADEGVLEVGDLEDCYSKADQDLVKCLDAVSQGKRYMALFFIDIQP